MLKISTNKVQFSVDAGFFHLTSQLRVSAGLNNTYCIQWLRKALPGCGVLLGGIHNTDQTYSPVGNIRTVSTLSLCADASIAHVFSTMFEQFICASNGSSPSQFQISFEASRVVPLRTLQAVDVLLVSELTNQHKLTKNIYSIQPKTNPSSEKGSVICPPCRIGFATSNIERTIRLMDILVGIPLSAVCPNSKHGSQVHRMSVGLGAGSYEIPEIPIGGINCYYLGASPFFFRSKSLTNMMLGSINLALRLANDPEASDAVLNMFSDNLIIACIQSMDKDAIKAAFEQLKKLSLILDEGMSTGFSLLNHKVFECLEWLAQDRERFANLFKPFLSKTIMEYKDYLSPTQYLYQHVQKNKQPH